MAPKAKDAPARAQSPSKKKQKSEGAEAAEKHQKSGGKQTRAGGKRAAKAEGLPQPTIIDILLADHRETVTLLRKFQKEAKRPAPDALMLEKLVDAICVVIRLHSQAEMDVLYPLIDKQLGKGKSSHSLEEHMQIEANLAKALELRKKGGAELNGLIDEVAKDFERHLHEEEDELMPALLEQLGEDREALVDLASQFMAAKEKAPLEPQASPEKAKVPQGQREEGLEVEVEA